MKSPNTISTINYHFYKKMKITSRILTELAAEESGHYQLLKTYTQKEVGPKKGKVRFYVWIARLFRAYFQYQTDGK